MKNLFQVSSIRSYHTIVLNRRTVAITLASVQVQLANEENTEASRGILCLHETSPALFLQKGLELEDQQYTLL